MFGKSHSGAIAEWVRASALSHLRHYSDNSNLWGMMKTSVKWTSTVDRRPSSSWRFQLVDVEHWRFQLVGIDGYNNHSPQRQQSQNPYAMKRVPPTPRPIRPSQTKATVKVDTAARSCSFTYKCHRIPIWNKIFLPTADSIWRFSWFAVHYKWRIPLSHHGWMINEIVYFGATAKNHLI